MTGRSNSRNLSRRPPIKRGEAGDARPHGVERRKARMLVGLDAMPTALDWDEDD
jgi:hypothetical protein